MKTGFKSIETRKAHHIHKILQFNIQVREGENQKTAFRNNKNYLSFFENFLQF